MLERMIKCTLPSWTILNSVKCILRSRKSETGRQYAISYLKTGARTVSRFGLHWFPFFSIKVTISKKFPFERWHDVSGYRMIWVFISLSLSFSWRKSYARLILLFTLNFIVIVVKSPSPPSSSSFSWPASRSLSGVIPPACFWKSCLTTWSASSLLTFCFIPFSSILFWCRWKFARRGQPDADVWIARIFARRGCLSDADVWKKQIFV